VFVQPQLEVEMFKKNFRDLSIRNLIIAATIVFILVCLVHDGIQAYQGDLTLDTSHFGGLVALTGMALLAAYWDRFCTWLENLENDADL
jgi:hypothetical protein